MKVRLKEKRPFLYKQQEVWFEAGEEFEVLNKKDFKMMGLGYSIRSIKWRMKLDGFHNAIDFEYITQNEKEE